MRHFIWMSLMPLLAVGREIPVADAKTLERAAAEAQPGDVLLLREGEWRDVPLVVSARGTEQAPVTLRAARPGKTVITGSSTLRLGGEHLVVEGLHFRNPDAVDVVEFRLRAGHVANRVRLTQCAFTSDVPPPSTQDARWVGLYGRGHRVDHCWFQGKTGKGATLVVWLEDANEPPAHRIDHNYFGSRAPLGENGGETIRIGDSKTSMQVAACVVERNLFERCNGEVECISNKSCGNRYRDNTFLAVSGTLTLRHGNGCLVEGNVFLGRGEKGTGGVRVIGEDHVVRGNYFEDLAGKGLRGALTLMLGIPDSPPHGYFQVKRARIEANVWVRCAQPLVIGWEGDKTAGRPSLPPLDCELLGNRVYAPGAMVVDARCDLSGLRWRDNEFWGKSIGLPEQEGVRWREPEWSQRTGLTRGEVGPAWMPDVPPSR